MPAAGNETEKKVSESCCWDTVAAVALGRVLRAVAFVSGRKLLMNKFSSPLAVAWHIRVLFFVACWLLVGGYSTRQNAVKENEFYAAANYFVILRLLGTVVE